MAGVCRVINLEEGMPTVEEAKKRLVDELRKAKASRVKVIKIIHGYGSTGQGGRIKQAMRPFLSSRKRGKGIEAYVSGENWEVFDETTRMILDKCPEMSRDRDLGQANPGITIVLL